MILIKPAAFCWMLFKILRPLWKTTVPRELQRKSHENLLLWNKQLPVWRRRNLVYHKWLWIKDAWMFLGVKKKNNGLRERESNKSEKKQIVKWQIKGRGEKKYLLIYCYNIDRHTISVHWEKNTMKKLTISVRLSNRFSSLSITPIIYVGLSMLILLERRTEFV